LTGNVVGAGSECFSPDSKTSEQVLFNRVMLKYLFIIYNIKFCISVICLQNVALLKCVSIN